MLNPVMGCGFLAILIKHFMDLFHTVISWSRSASVHNFEAFCAAQASACSVLPPTRRGLLCLCADGGTRLTGPESHHMDICPTPAESYNGVMQRRPRPGSDVFRLQSKARTETLQWDKTECVSCLLWLLNATRIEQYTFFLKKTDVVLLIFTYVMKYNYSAECLS
jgi:hypothetical protein